MSDRPSDRLAQLGIELPAIVKPLASYLPWTRAGSMVYVSGQLPMQDGQLRYVGKVGQDRSMEDAVDAARLCAINAMAVLADAAGSIDNIVHIVKANVHVNCAAGFTDAHLVANGASDLFFEVFGEQGRHARAALGAWDLPLGATVEVELIAQAK